MDAPLARPRRIKSERRRLPRRLTDRLWDVRRRYTYGVPAAILFALTLLGVYAFWLEPNRLIVKRVDIPLPGWPGGRPLRVVAIGDIHGGAPYMTAQKIKSMVQLANRQKPDVVALLGDYVILGVLGGRFMEPETVAGALSGLSAPGGVFAVLGNHDWWYNGPRLRTALERAGFRVLEDEVATITVDGRKVHVAGLADEWTRRPDVEKTLALLPAGEPALVLTHGPDLFPKIPRLNGLTLAAHTHGGQVRLPLMGAPIVPSRYRQRYVAGIVREGDRTMFVTSGVGTSVLPVRLGVPPEIAVLTLKGKDEAASKTPAP